MRRTARCSKTSAQGFSLIEVLISLTITLIVMSSVFALLTKGQRSFEREPEIAELQQNARASLDAVAKDLIVAGYRTPPTIAVQWADGGGTTPDEITIIYGEALSPVVEALPCSEQGGGPCNTIGNSAVLFVDIDTFDPPQADPLAAYYDGMALVILETDDCNGDGEMGIVPFELTNDPMMAGSKLKLQHNPGQSDIVLPPGFNGEVDPDCAVVGIFKIIQYRVNPLPPADNPTLERRDLGAGADWIPLAANIEDFQVQYGVGTATNWVDSPASPDPNDPETWITRVSLSIRARSESTNLEGGTTVNAASPEDTHIRKTYATTMSLRNLVNATSQFYFLNP